MMIIHLTEVCLNNINDCGVHLPSKTPASRLERPIFDPRNVHNIIDGQKPSFHVKANTTSTVDPITKGTYTFPSST